MNLQDAIESNEFPMKVQRVIRNESTDSRSSSKSHTRRGLQNTNVLTPIMKSRLAHYKQEVMLQLNPDLPPSGAFVPTNPGDPVGWRTNTTPSKSRLFMF